MAKLTEACISPKKAGIHSYIHDLENTLSETSALVEVLYTRLESILREELVSDPCTEEGKLLNISKTTKMIYEMTCRNSLTNDRMKSLINRIDIAE